MLLHSHIQKKMFINIHVHIYLYRKMATDKDKIIQYIDLTSCPEFLAVTFRPFQFSYPEEYSHFVNKTGSFYFSNKDKASIGAK